MVSKKNENPFDDLLGEVSAGMGGGKLVEDMERYNDYMENLKKRLRRGAKFGIQTEELDVDEILAGAKSDLEKMGLKLEEESEEEIRVEVEGYNDRFREAMKKRAEMLPIDSGFGERMEKERRAKEFAKRREQRRKFIKDNLEIALDLIRAGDLKVGYDFVTYMNEELEKKGMSFVSEEEYKKIVGRLEEAEGEWLNRKNKVEKVVGEGKLKDKILKEWFRKNYKDLSERLEGFLERFPVGTRVKKGQWGAKEDGVVWGFVEIDPDLVGEDEEVDAYQQMYGGIVYVVTGVSKEGNLQGYKFKPVRGDLQESGERVVYGRADLVRECRSKGTTLVVGEEGNRLGKIEEVGPNGRYVKVMLFEGGKGGGGGKVKKRWYDFERLYEDNKQVLG